MRPKLQPLLLSYEDQHLIVFNHSPRCCWFVARIIFKNLFLEYNFCIRNSLFIYWDFWNSDILDFLNAQEQWFSNPSSQLTFLEFQNFGGTYSETWRSQVLKVALWFRYSAFTYMFRFGSLASTFCYGVQAVLFLMYTGYPILGIFYILSPPPKCFQNLGYILHTPPPHQIFLGPPWDTTFHKSNVGPHIISNRWAWHLDAKGLFP